MAKSPVTDGKIRAEQATSAPGVRPEGRGFAAWVRWGALAWLLFWFVTYWIVWGPRTFAYLCDIAVMVTCIGLWTNSALLISSQAVSSLIVDAMWAVDAISAAAFGRHVFGGTEYLFNPVHPLWIRLLSLYHVFLPLVLLWAVHRLGYDRRGWKLQAGVVTVAFVAARFTPATQNINFAYRLPVVNRPFGPAPVHVAVSILFMIFVVYWPTHWVLRKLFSPPRGKNGGEPPHST